MKSLHDEGLNILDEAGILAADDCFGGIEDVGTRYGFTERRDWERIAQDVIIQIGNLAFDLEKTT